MFDLSRWQELASTKEDSLARAKDFAEDWYLRSKESNSRALKVGKTFQKAADQFLREYEIITAGERNAEYVESVGMRLRVHLLPFFGDKVLSEITPGLVQEYRIHRVTSRKDKKTGEANATGAKHASPRNRDVAARSENREPSRLAALSA